ncbi:DUF6428 family protein [Yoonia sp. R2-816]|uniref:DUF6428 family protein n=1 Tax=Yoonia sp. R2-816 TaxID=3342638 RepID=UPI003728905B
MATTVTTLDQLVNELEGTTADLPLVFRTDAGDIGAGYHVTELKHLSVNSIDCGGRRSNWEEAQLQLLDGSHGTHMSAGKFASIARRSVAVIDGLGTVPISVEYAPQNQGLRRYLIDRLQADDNGLRVVLVEDGAVCKPRQEMSCAPPTTQKAAPEDRLKKDCCGWA